MAKRIREMSSLKYGRPAKEVEEYVNNRLGPVAGAPEIPSAGGFGGFGGAGGRPSHFGGFGSGAPRPFGGFGGFGAKPSPVGQPLSQDNGIDVKPTSPVKPATPRPITPSSNNNPDDTLI